MAITITPIKTDLVEPSRWTMTSLLDKFLPAVTEGSVVAVSSKIVALCEGRVQPLTEDKERLIQQESDYYLPAEESKYAHHFSVIGDTVVGSAGIDESNAAGRYVLWPSDPQTTANTIRAHLRQKHGLKNLGVIITDSISIPMRLGAVGTAIAYSGFDPLKNYVGKHDLFGREFGIERANQAEGLAAAAVLAMGEGAEQTPLAVIEGAPLDFEDSDPTANELAEYRLTLDTDLFEAFYKNAPWRRGNHG